MKKKTKANILAIGTSLTDELTVLGHVDSGAADPVYIVWNHKTWCPMVCKHFASPYLAKIEAERLRSLSHPNIVRCLGLVQPGCLLMPFLAGPTLASLVDTSSRVMFQSMTPCASPSTSPARFTTCTAKACCTWTSSLTTSL